jgi:hypothetical protein
MVLVLPEIHVRFQFPIADIQQLRGAARADADPASGVDEKAAFALGAGAQYPANPKP